MQKPTIIADGNADNPICIHCHQRFPITVLRILALNKHRHHPAEGCSHSVGGQVLQPATLTTEIQATVIRHGRHNQAGNLCCLAFVCFSNLYHSIHS
jgi:hypothetical protein